MVEPRKIPLDWQIPEGMPILFANHMLVTEIHGQMLVTFFQAQPPVVLDGQESKWDTIDSVPAVAVARLAIPASQIPSVIAALQAKYDAFIEAQRAASEGDDDG